jgi:putative sterol carrier protein
MASSPSPTQEFFEALPQRTGDPLLAKVSGTLRFDAKDGDRIEHWYVTLDKGAVKVSKRNAKADAVIRIDRSLLDGIVTGHENAMAALLRGALIPEGDPALMLRFQRIFSGPPRLPTTPTARNTRNSR